MRNIVSAAGMSEHQATIFYTNYAHHFRYQTFRYKNKKEYKNIAL